MAELKAWTLIDFACSQFVCHISLNTAESGQFPGKIWRLSWARWIHSLPHIGLAEKLKTTVTAGPGSSPSSSK